MASGHQDTTKVYHYTDRQGIEGIVGSGRIRPSTDVTRDAVLGKGTYFTSMPPTRNSTKIAQNNWDDGPRHAKSMVKEGRTDYAVELQVPKHELVENNGSRNVMMKPGGVRLNDYPHNIYYRENGRDVYKLT